jgi:hypothetical protein
LYFPPQTEAFLAFLRDELASADKELLVVVTGETAADDRWRRKMSSSS